MPRLSQETIALIGVGIALGALVLTTTSRLHGDIQAIRAEARADRGASERRLEAFERRTAADREASDRRLEAFERRTAADRETSERRMIDFERQIIRLIEQQGTLGGLVEGLRHRPPVGAGSNEPPG